MPQHKYTVTAGLSNKSLLKSLAIGFDVGLVVVTVVAIVVVLVPNDWKCCATNKMEINTCVIK